MASSGQYPRDSSKPSLNGGNPPSNSFKVAGVEVSEELARALADRSTDPNARDSRSPVPGEINSLRREPVDDEKIRELTAKYTGRTELGTGRPGYQQKAGEAKGRAEGAGEYLLNKAGQGKDKLAEAGENVAGKAGQAKDAVARKAGEVKSGVANKAGEVTGRAERAVERAGEEFNRGANKGRRQQQDGYGRTDRDKFKDNFRPHDEDEEEEKEGKSVFKRPLLMTGIILGVSAIVGVLLTGRNGKRPQATVREGSS